jgi:hypothetical protein
MKSNGDYILMPIGPEVSQKETQELAIGSVEYMKRVLTSDTVKHLIAGGAAGAVSRTIVSPLERMKILFQASCNTCLVDCFRNTTHFNDCISIA